MSRKQPEIKIVYPDATPAAMLLTEAMIKRSTGKRVVETESEEKEYTGEALFGGVLTCKTDTSVELTLKLNSDAMDYTLTTLIAKNLTEEEKQAIRMETDSMEVVDLLSPHAGEAAGAGTCTEEVGSACRAADVAPTQSGEQDAIDVPLLEAPKEEKQIEVGKISDNTLRDILSDMAERLEHEDAIEVIEETIKEIDHKAGVIEEENPVLIQEDTVLLDMLSVLICGSIRVNNKRITELKTYASNVAHYLNDAHPDDKNVFVVAARDLADALFSVQHDFTEDANRTLDAETLVRKNKRIDSREEPTWGDVTKEARKIGLHKTDKTDKTDEQQDGEIDPGLLDDIEDGPAPAGEVIGHDE